jgi:hypothetical protein
VSIVDNGYVYVRGLGERYSATMLNNALIPTTEPERRVVPLDMFPAALIDNIKVLKTYTPDLPGEFGGGLVQMQTIEFPTKRLFQAILRYGFNSRTTFDLPKLSGGARDFWGSTMEPARLALDPQTKIVPWKLYGRRVSAVRPLLCGQLAARVQGVGSTGTDLFSDGWRHLRPPWSRRGLYV